MWTDIAFHHPAALPDVSYQTSQIKSMALLLFPFHLEVQPTGLPPFPSIWTILWSTASSLAVEKSNGWFLVPIHLLSI